jgi:hypothetical protein
VARGGGSYVLHAVSHRVRTGGADGAPRGRARGIRRASRSRPSTSGQPARGPADLCLSASRSVPGGASHNQFRRHGAGACLAQANSSDPAAVMSRMLGNLAPLRQRGLRVLVASQLMFNVGDMVYDVALPWYVLADHGGCCCSGPFSPYTAPPHSPDSGRGSGREGAPRHPHCQGRAEANSPRDTAFALQFALHVAAKRDGRRKLPAQHDRIARPDLFQGPGNRSGATEKPPTSTARRSPRWAPPS